MKGGPKKLGKEKWTETAADTKLRMAYRKG
jgi:hypothetical protein